MQNTCGTRACHKDVLKYLNMEELMKYWKTIYFQASKEEIEPISKREKKKKVIHDVFVAYLGESGIVLEGGHFESNTKESWGESKYLGSDSDIERVYIDKEGVHMVDKQNPDYMLKDKMQILSIQANAKDRELREYEATEKQRIRNFFRRLFFKETKKLPENISFMSASTVERMLAENAHEAFALEDYFLETEKNGLKENPHFVQTYEELKEKAKQEEEQKTENA